MKKLIRIVLCLTAGVLMLSTPALAGGMSSAEIERKFEAMEKRMERLEMSVREKDKEIEALKMQTPGTEKEPEGLKWYDRIERSGAVEVEFGNVHEDFKDNTVDGLPS
ncbi:MAG: hypothetical protein JRH09_15815, partial [Deltaproteobacteria bacterium]|nr:hypothetical protein [Deltaproteobacteria bacterium]